MKKLLITLVICVLSASIAFAIPPSPPSPSSGDFKADGTVPMTGPLIPSAANTLAVGSTAAEWADLYLGDGAIIYGQNDQSNTITSSATGWAFVGAVSANNVNPDAADGATLGTTALEWSDLYMADGAVIYGQNDQSNTITSSATGWAFNLPVTIGGAAGVKLTGDGDGAITFLGLGDGSDEDLTLNFDDTSNTVVMSSSTGVTSLSTGAIGIASTAGFTGPIIPTAITVTSATTNFPAASAGTIYQVTTSDGNPAWLGGAAGLGYVVNTGDWLICINTSAGGTYAVVGGDWNIQQRVVAMPDGYRQLWLTNNTAITTVAGDNTIAVEGNVLKVIQNGTEYASTLSPTAGQITFSGTSAARTITVPDAAFTVARTDAANTFTGVQTMTNPLITEYRTIYVPASAMTPTTTNGAAAGTKEYATNDIMFDYLAFDTTTEEYAAFNMPMPEGWDRSTIKVKAFWAPGTDSGAVGDTVEWEVACGALSNGDTIDAALGTAQVIQDAVVTGESASMHLTGATPAITCGGTPALSDLIHFKVSRNVGNDNHGYDAWLLGLWIQYQVSNAAAGW